MPPTTKNRIKAVYHSAAFKIAELLLFIFVLYLLARLAVLFFSFVPYACAFHTLTNLDCPGCGMTRALFSLMQGDVWAAFDYNLLWPVTLLLLMLLPAAYFLKRFTGKNILSTYLYSGKLWFTVLGVYIAFSVLRNIPIAPFTWLYA